MAVLLFSSGINTAMLPVAHTHVGARRTVFLALLFSLLLANSLFAQAPDVRLVSPENGVSSTDAQPEFSFTASSTVSQKLECDLYIDGSIAARDVLLSSGQTYKVKKLLQLGGHEWRVACSDIYKAEGESERRFYSVAIETYDQPKVSPPLTLASMADFFLSSPLFWLIPFALLPATLLIILLWTKQRKEE